MQKLTGIGKIYNGIKYDFPLKECISSVLEGAEEFILVVCKDSEDNTIEFCKDMASKEPRLKLIYDVWRETPTENYKNMARLANKAISSVKTDWFVSVDMDEIMPLNASKNLVLYLNSIPNDIGVVQLRFHHLYFDIKHEILGKLYPHIHRIARSKMDWQSGSDGCGLGGGKGKEFITNICTCHYGYLREMQIALEKETRFQIDLYHNGVQGLPDSRLIDFFKNPPKSSKDFWQAFVSPNDKVIHYNGPNQHPLAIRKYGKINDL